MTVSAAIYAVHGFVRVEVDPRVGAGRLRSIDTQLAGLRTDAPRDAAAVLRVLPYEAYRRGPRPVQTRRDVLVSDRSIDFTREGWAVRFGDDAIDLYFGARSQPVNPYLQWLLAPQGVTFVHAAAIEQDGRALLVPAFGGAGKTAISVSLVRRGLARFMGDDVVLLGRDGRVHSFPRALILYPSHRELLPEYFARRGTALTVQGRVNRLRRRAWRAMPLKPLAREAARRLGVERYARAAVETQEYLAAVSPGELFGEGRVASTARLSRVVALERAAVERPEWTEMDIASISERIFAIIHHEWASYWEPFLVAGGAGLIDLGAYYAHVTGTIEAALQPVGGARMLTVPFAFPGEQLIEHVPAQW